MFREKELNSKWIRPPLKSDVRVFITNQNRAHFYMGSVGIEKIIKVATKKYYRVLLSGRMDRDIELWKLDEKPRDISIVYKGVARNPLEYLKEDEVIRLLNPEVIKKWIPRVTAVTGDEDGLIKFYVLLKCDVWVKDEWN